jgi:hypothetical protein
MLHAMITYFFKLSNINYLRLDSSIDLYWLKFLSMLHDVVSTYLKKKGIYLGLKL